MSRKDKSQTRTFDPRRSFSGKPSCEGKQRFSNEKDAAEESDFLYISYYKCDWCNGYHLTSKKEETE